MLSFLNQFEQHSNAKLLEIDFTKLHECSESAAMAQFPLCAFLFKLLARICLVVFKNFPQMHEAYSHLIGWIITPKKCL